MMKNNIASNKGNYSLDTVGREVLFDKKRAVDAGEEYYEYRRQWRELPGQRFVSEYPILVDLELSTACNLHCRFCYTASNEYRKKVKPRFMEFALFRKIIDEIRGHVFAIRLSLRGESTLHPDFIKAVRYAKEKGIGEISVLTNGSRLTPKFFTRIMQAGIDWITLSFDGLYHEYEKNRAPLKFSVMYGRLKKIRAIKKKARSVKPVIKIQSIWPAIADNPTEFYQKMSAVSDLVAFNPFIDFRRRRGVNIEYEDQFSCPQIYQRLVVGVDGRAMLCANDEGSDHIVGDAARETIYAIWHGVKLNVARELHAQAGGFMKIRICRKCYLPRKLRKELRKVGERRIAVPSYI